MNIGELRLSKRRRKNRLLPLQILLNNIHNRDKYHDYDKCLMYKSMVMNSKYVLHAKIGEERPPGSRGSNSRREVEKFKDLRPGQILSVSNTCDKFLESRGLKQVPS